MKQLTILFAAAIALILVAPPAGAEPPSEEWLELPAGFTNSDVLDFASALVTIAANREAAGTNGIVEMEIALLAGDGKTHIEMLVEEAAIAQLQSQPPGQQTAQFLAIQEGIVGELAGDELEATGLFNRYTSRSTALSQAMMSFMQSRGVDDIVFSIGFGRGEENHLYATVNSGRVDFAPDCPQAGF